jgi:hypothetical protein
MRRLPKCLLNKTSQEHITVTIKKATELYIVGGTAYDPSLEKNVFWYAVRKYPVMSKALQRETGTKSKTEYIQKYRPEWLEGTEPPEGYEEFYKNLPSVFEEGSPWQIERSRPGKIGPSVTIVEPTQIQYDVEPTGEAEADVPVVEEIIKRIRQLVWEYPVEGKFTSTTGLQGKDLQQFINSNLKRAHKTMRLQRFAQNFRVNPEATRYVDVATGTIFTSEDAVKQAIEDYHAEPDLAAAASKGGIFMNSIGELLKIADHLDEQGDFESADEIAAIVREMAEDETSQKGLTEEKRAWARQAITTLVKVADSLEDKGAVKEAQMADQILHDFQQSLPQAFNFGPPTSTLETLTDTLETPTIPTEVPADREVVVEEPQVEVEGVPFTDLEKGTEPADEVTVEEAADLREVTIEEPSEPEANFDEMTIPEFKEMIEGLRWRHSQGPKRQKYEEILKNLEKANDYLQAHKEWSEYAHRLFEDEPIRIKFE